MKRRKGLQFREVRRHGSEVSEGIVQFAALVQPERAVPFREPDSRDRSGENVGIDERFHPSNSSRTYLGKRASKHSGCRSDFPAHGHAGNWRQPHQSLPSLHDDNFFTGERLCQKARKMSPCLLDVDEDARD